MNATDIPRYDLTTAAHTTDRERLAIAASSKLGYTRLAQAVTIKGSLMAALITCEIAPLLTHKVEEYKASKEWTALLRPSTWKCLAITFAVLLYGSFTIFASATWGPNAGGKLFALFAFMGLTSIIAACITVACWVDNGVRSVPRKAIFWKSTPLSTYSGSVPEFVLRKAIQIKEACPDVQFDIEYLVRGSDPVDVSNIERARELKEVARLQRMRDPFLVAYLGENRVDTNTRDRYGNRITSIRPTESFYIDVWDEREYERSL